MTQPDQNPDSSAVIVQITDTHLLADPSARLGGWHTQAALDAVLTHIRTQQPRIDAILVTGDLVHDESTAGYQRLAHSLSEFGVPVAVIPGNHDDPDSMPNAMRGIQVGGHMQVREWAVHLLDSHVPGSDAGRLGEAQMHQLGAALAASPAPALIALHHPPAPVGSAWIDAIGLMDGPELFTLLADYPQVRAVVCGHVHQASDQQLGQIRQWTTPSTAKQFLPASTEHAEDNTVTPGYRMIQLHDNGACDSQVLRVASARARGLG